jgi:TolA-binding protein
LRKVFIHTVVFLFIGITAFGQQTAVYDDFVKDYKTAVELFDKEKFGAAQHHFNKTIKRIDNPQSEIRVNSEFYSALCALELFNKDAEHLLTQFVTNHPESPQVKIAYFNLGKYNYLKKNWENTIYYFDKLDVFDLSQKELAEYYFKKGYAFFMLDKFKEASKLFYEIKDVDTEYTDPARYYFAHISYQQKDYQTALESFKN